MEFGKTGLNPMRQNQKLLTYYKEVLQETALINKPGILSHEIFVKHNGQKIIFRPDILHRVLERIGFVIADIKVGIVSVFYFAVKLSTGGCVYLKSSSGVLEENIFTSFMKCAWSR
jgi:hypothetical protein